MEILQAKAKVNLTLSVLGRRPDGYHDLELIFQPVSLADRLEVEESGDEEMHFTCSVPEFANEKNLAWRAWKLMREHFPGKVRGLNVYLEKRIPSGAGMAGGSTDASALMLWMNRHFALGLSEQELIDLGVTLGADVPACMRNRASIGRGVGEKLTDIEMRSEYPLLLLKPSVSFPTGEMFRRLDKAGYENRPESGPAMIRAMESDDPEAMAAAMYNAFEEAVPDPERIFGLKRALTDAGALGSVMTGSGSVVYGLFRRDEERDRAAELLKELPDCQVICCHTVNQPNPWETEK